LELSCDKKDSEITKLKSTIEDEKAKLRHLKDDQKIKLNGQDTNFRAKIALANNKNGVTLLESKLEIMQ
jgi:hypothetical protein